jgi:hypothetical protein
MNTKVYWKKETRETVADAHAITSGHFRSGFLPARAASGDVTSSSSTTSLQNKCGVFRSHILLHSLDRRFYFGKKTLWKGMLFSDYSSILFGCRLLVCIENWSSTSRMENLPFRAKVLWRLLVTGRDRVRIATFPAFLSFNRPFYS